MLVIALVGMPLVLLYTAYVYRHVPAMTAPGAPRGGLRPLAIALAITAGTRGAPASGTRGARAWHAGWPRLARGAPLSPAAGTRGGRAWHGGAAVARR